VEKEGILAISGSVLNAVFSNISPNENVFFENKDGNLLVRTKRSQIKLKGTPPDDFPTIPLVAGTSFEIESKKLIEGIKSVYYSSSVSDIKPEISSVFIYSSDNNLIFVSTDSFRLAEKKIKIKGVVENLRILIPFKNIAEILKVFGEFPGVLKVCFNKNQISFSSDNIYLTSRIIDGIFPDYRQIMPTETKTGVVVLKSDLQNALKVSNVFTDRLNQVNLKVSVKDGLFELSSRSSDIGESTTKLEATLQGEDLEVSFNVRYLLDCLSAITSDSISLKFNGRGRPIMISGIGDNSFTYLIMPLNR